VIIYHIIELLNLSELDRIYPEILELCLDAVHSKRELQKCVLNTKTNMQATNTAGMSKVYHGARVRVTVWGKEREREETRRLYKDRHADMELTTDSKTNGEDEVFPLKE